MRVRMLFKKVTKQLITYADSPPITQCYVGIFGDALRRVSILEENELQNPNYQRKASYYTSSPRWMRKSENLSTALEVFFKRQIV